MAPPENLDGGHRAIVIEDVPPGTGIGDLVGAFSPFGAIQFASMGPPAIVGFASEEAAAHALLVASMKSVSLLGVYREKAAPAERLVADTPPKTTTSRIEAAAPEEATGTAAETKTSQNKAASAPAVHVDQEAIRSLVDSIAALEKSLDALNRLLNEQSSKKEEDDDDDIDDYDYDGAWTDGYSSALYWRNDNYYDAWFAGYQAGVKDSPVG
ncbi:hypothetical protein ZWY2020_044939 [Hordeum vulgare]|nr:hypothetical protein ZWY2020_044939 [Hordeum vulgare]